MQQDWSIQSRSHQCSITGEPFQEGEPFYTLLFDEKTGYRREDVSETAFKARPEDSPQPFSIWRSKYEPPPPPAAEAIGKETAEDLLRRYMEMEVSSPQHANARYILAVMLERKKLLREVEVKLDSDGGLVRVYVHAKSGEVFVIPDPQLRLDQIADVQSQVAELLEPS